MIKFLPRVLAAFALLLAPALHAQEAKDADPALWVVKDADTTIYLFGTVHVLKPGLSWFDEAVKTAFDASDTLVLELVEPDTPTMQGLILKTALSPDGPTLTQKLPADKREAYASEMADIGMAPVALDRFDPWFAALTLSMAGLPRLGYDPESGAERTLTVAAKAANKPVIGLETAEQQIGYFDTMPEALQIDYLVSTIDAYPRLGETLDKMVATWAAGDPDTLGTVLNEEMRDTPELAKLLLADRNARWADWIDARLKTPGTVFVAVGAGHLAGGDSVQAQLARHKIKAERVAY